jgi:hypothetical protein
MDCTWQGVILLMAFNRIGPFAIFERFKDDWLVSRQALKLFSISTVFVLATAPILLGHMILEKQSAVQQLLWGTEGVLGPISIFFLWFGMWRYWLRLDSSTGILKGTSFFLLLAGLWFGAVPYCFFVYRPQVLSRTWATPNLDEESEEDETPPWGARKKLITRIVSISAGIFVFGLLIPKLIRKYGSEEGLYAYLTIASFLLILLAIAFIIGYPLLHLYRLGMRRRR